MVSSKDVPIFMINTVPYKYMILEKAGLEDEYKSMLEKNQKEMEDMQKTFEQKLAEAQAQVGCAKYLNRN